jgi:hypothetical protein
MASIASSLAWRSRARIFGFIATSFQSRGKLLRATTNACFDD